MGTLTTRSLIQEVKGQPSDVAPAILPDASRERPEQTLATYQEMTDALDCGRGMTAHPLRRPTRRRPRRNIVALKSTLTVRAVVTRGSSLLNVEGFADKTW